MKYLLIETYSLYEMDEQALDTSTNTLGSYDSFDKCKEVAKSNLDSHFIDTALALFDENSKAISNFRAEYFRNMREKTENSLSLDSLRKDNIIVILQNVYYAENWIENITYSIIKIN